MKRLSAIIILSLVSLLCFAQEGSIALLDKAAGKRVSFKYTYSLNQGSGMKEVTKGDVIAEGSCFLVTGLDLKSYSDGETCWMVDESTKEVLVDNVANDDVFSNPALLIANYKNFLDKIHVNKEGKDSLDVTVDLDEETSIRFKLTSVVFSEPQGKAEFVFDTSALPSSWVVTDLR